MSAVTEVLAAGLVGCAVALALRPRGGRRPRGGWRSRQALAGSARRLPPARARSLRAALAAVAARLRRRRMLVHVADAMPDVCRALAAELRAGAAPATALAAVAPAAPACASAALLRASRAVALGLDAGETLREAEPELGRAAPALGALWSVGRQSGAALAGALDRVAAALAAERAVEREVAAQLAGPRAAAAVVASLPLVGLALAAAAGGEPVGFLLGTPVGVGCTVVGTALDAAGVLWLRAITRRAAR